MSDTANAFFMYRAMLVLSIKYKDTNNIEYFQNLCDMCVVQLLTN